MVSPALAWLLDPPPRSSGSLGPGGAGGALPAGLTAQQLGALVAEGLVVPVPGGHLAADAAACPAARAAALAQHLEPGEVVGGAAALWVRGALARCGVVDVLVARGRTGGSRSDPPWRRTRTAALPAGHVEVLSGLRVTGLDRTAADVVLWHPPQRAEVLVRAAVAAALTRGWRWRRCRDRRDRVSGWGAGSCWRCSRGCRPAGAQACRLPVRR